MIGGDPTRLEDLARGVRRLGAQVGLAADHIRHTEQVEWVSTAAGEFRDRLRSHADWVERCRDDIARAAVLLDELAQTLRERQAAIRAAESFVRGLLEAARETIDALVGIPTDALDVDQRQSLARAHGVVETVPSLPHRGAPEWLDLARRVGGRGRG
jgi:acyl-CoA reductase-like NAD-dependent aldehyde dehydrogenase